MISAFWIGLLAMTPAEQPQPLPCRGVAIPSDTGRANFVLISATGDDASLERFKAGAAAMRNFRVIGPTEISGEPTILVSFQTARSDPSLSTDPRDALSFLDRAEDGEFGPLAVRPMIMPIDSLPDDIC